MPIRSAVGSLILGAWLGACAQPSRPVPVLGAQVDLAQLAGEWQGEYSSPVTGRSGSILFRLTAGTDTAQGDVVMDPPRWARPLTPGDAYQARETIPQPPQVLTINFVRVAGGRVSGTLAPYVAPDCGCLLLTTFEGSLSGDVLEGTYVSRHQQSGETQSGRWKVTRTR